MTYDLGDCVTWEFMFPSNDKPQLQLPEDDDFDDMDEEVLACDLLLILKIFSTANFNVCKLNTYLKPYLVILEKKI